MNNFFLYILMGGSLGIAILIINVIMNSIRKKPLELQLFGIPVLMIVVGLFGFGYTAEADMKSSAVGTTSTLEAELSVSKDTTTQPETKTEPETTTIEETTSKESEEEFKASCQEIGYKKLLRTPEEYVGQRIVITAKVQQVVGGGLFDDETYYRVQTDKDGYEWYHDDEYFMYDSRIDDDMKILEADVLKIYAEFTGLEDVRRAITGSNEEVPAIKAYYVELISE